MKGKYTVSQLWFGVLDVYCSSLLEIVVKKRKSVTVRVFEDFSLSEVVCYVIIICYYSYSTLPSSTVLSRERASVILIFALISEPKFSPISFTNTVSYYLLRINFSFYSNVGDE